MKKGGGGKTVWYSKKGCWRGIPGCVGLYLQLMAEGFPPTPIAKEDRLEYFKTLDAYAVEGNLQPFVELVAGLVDRQMERYIELSGPQQERSKSPTLQ